MQCCNCYSPLLTVMGCYLCLSSHPFVLLQVEEEAARLASMPAWRRDMMKKKMDEER